MIKLDFLKDQRRYSWDEKGMGYLFADTFKDSARYVTERNGWMVYTGKRWELDIGGMMVKKKAKTLVEYMSTKINDVEDHVREKYVKLLCSLYKVRGRDNMISDAASEYTISYDVFDRNKFLLNCQNGTYNLKTFKLQPFNPTDYISMITNVSYNESANCPRWNKFISEIMQDNAEMASYLQRCLGYSLSGHTGYECMFIFIGNTARNGKGTTVETIINILGDYARTAKTETLALQPTQSGSAHSEDLARLKSARFVAMSEPKKGMQLDVQRVKNITGGEKITARSLNERSFDYIPEFKIYMSANNLPSVNDITLFTGDRLKIVPFDRHFRPEERDLTLKDKFQEPQNMQGIFNWCIEGYRQLQLVGIKMPTAAKEVLREYQETSDTFLQFMHTYYSEVENDPSAYILGVDAYNQYTKWCAENGIKSWSSKAFYKEHRERYGISRTTHGRDGIRLIGWTTLDIFGDDDDEPENSKIYSLYSMAK